MFCEINMFVCNQVAKFYEILMFVSKKTQNNSVTAQGLYCILTSPMSTVSSVFGVFLETNKHQNLTRLRSPIVGHK